MAETPGQLSFDVGPPPRAGTVIGCVWGAWRRLVEAHGPAAPTYVECEQVWTTYRLSKKHRVPVDPEALTADIARLLLLDA